MLRAVQKGAQGGGNPKKGVSPPREEEGERPIKIPQLELNLQDHPLIQEEINKQEREVVRCFYDFKGVKAQDIAKKSPTELIWKLIDYIENGGEAKKGWKASTKKCYGITILYELMRRLNMDLRNILSLSGVGMKKIVMSKKRVPGSNPGKKSKKKIFSFRKKKLIADIVRDIYGGCCGF